MALLSKDPNILVVDDDRDITDSLVEYLNKKGFRATGVYNGKQALAKFHQEGFTLIITDLQMPEMDGIELLEAVKRIDPDVIVVMLTGHGSIASAVKAIKQQAYDYISKPLQFSEIEVIVERALEKHSIFKQLRVFRGLFILMLFAVPFFILIWILLMSA